MFSGDRTPIAARCAVLLGLMLTLGGCGEDAQAKKIAYMQKGDAYFADGQYAAAVIEFRNTLKFDPQDAQGHYKLALSYLKKGGLPNLQQAFRELQRSVDLDPTIMDAQLKLGELSLLAKQFDKAQEHAEIVLKSTPESVDARLVLGQAYAGKRELEKAIAELRARTG